MNLTAEVAMAAPVIGALLIVLGRALWHAGSALLAYSKWRAEK